MKFFAFLTVILVAGSASQTRCENPRGGSRVADRREQAPLDAAGGLLTPSPAAADYPHLNNLLRVSPTIYTGGQPTRNAAFAELARLGVRTVVSVDGAIPDVEAARNAGLRYVHIPIGYDGVSQSAGQSLTRLVRDAEGPFYIHCHHGQHRGPAAAAIACIAAQQLTGPRALAILDAAGTSKDYGGLWRDVAAFTPPAENQPLPPLVETAPLDTLAAGMAKADRAFENLRSLSARNWQDQEEHPDVTAVQEAILLREAFHEMVRRLQEANDHDPRFSDWMADAEAGAKLLETRIAAGNSAGAEGALTRLKDQCARCHDRYR